jgi:regulator of replication initiation timing
VFQDRVVLTSRDILEKEFKLVEENIRLKQENRNLKTKLEVVSEDASNNNVGTSNADVLRRISNLEKIIYGNNK